MGGEVEMVITRGFSMWVGGWVGGGGGGGGGVKGFYQKAVCPIDKT